MNGFIAQTAALAIYGNEYLRGRPWTEFWPTANVFKFCKAVRFASEPVAPDPPAWFAQLKAAGVEGLRLHFASRKSALANDRELAAFIGGSRWLIEAVSREASSVWEAQWRVGTKEDRGYEVDYLCIDSHGQRLPRARLTVAELRSQIGDALQAVSLFAANNKLTQFTPSFQTAIAELKSDEPLVSTWASRDVRPGDFGHTTLLALDARQLLGAADAAMGVFGGMGSWNDQSFDGAAAQEFTQISDMLFRLGCDSICAAVNSARAP